MEKGDELDEEDGAVSRGLDTLAPAAAAAADGSCYGASAEAEAGRHRATLTPTRRRESWSHALNARTTAGQRTFSVLWSEPLESGAGFRLSGMRHERSIFSNCDSSVDNRRPPVEVASETSCSNSWHKE